MKGERCFGPIKVRDFKDLSVKQNIVSQGVARWVGDG